MLNKRLQLVGGDCKCGDWLKAAWSCRTGPLRAGRPLRGLCTFSGWLGCFGSPVGRG
jgi:hypothetical protein